MAQSVYTLAAASAFGLEGAVTGELKRLGMKNVHAENGAVLFSGNVQDAFLCNLSLRFSDRIYLLLAERKCDSFEALFQLVSSIPWEDYAGGKEAFNVSAQCARSRLMSPRDCQSITKKAILERMKARKGCRVFPENGAPFPVHVSVHSDQVRILLNLSGPSLSRRGYRTWNGEAPLRETLAAALVEFSPWRPGMPLYDPCCGTGTILIEAALRQGHIAPGRNRSFSMEQFVFFPKADGERIREKLRADCQYERIHSIAGSDIDPEAVTLALRHQNQAFRDSLIDFSVKPLQEVALTEEHGVFLCNPPYGERLSDTEHCRKLYQELRRLQDRHPTWALCAISSDPGFEKAFGRRADKRRRLYNGRLECQFYTYSAAVQ